MSADQYKGFPPFCRYEVIIPTVGHRELAGLAANLVSHVHRVLFNNAQ